MVHAPDERIQVPQTRYISGAFPGVIAAADIDDNLLHFWEAAQDGDSARRFIYYYRILEYASFSYLQAPTRLAVRKLLAAPDASDRVSEIVEEIVSVVQGTTLDEHAYPLASGVSAEMAAISTKWHVGPMICTRPPMTLVGHAILSQRLRQA